MKIIKSTLWGIILGTLFAAALLLYVGEPKLEPIWLVNESVDKAFNATCTIETSDKDIGTGVLLDTGYILTAAHVVDENNNNKIEDDERETKVTFHNHTGIVSVHSATALYTFRDDYLDYAVLEIKGGLYSEVSLDLLPPKLGDRVFTIGCTRGYAPHISAGLESTQTEDSGLLGRAGISVYSGNSGGGIFIETQRLVGVVSKVGVDTEYTRITFPIPSKEGFAFASTTIRRTIYLPNWTEYTRSHHIYLGLRNKGLGFTVVKPEKSNEILFIYLRAGAKTALQIIVVICAFYFTRKYLR